MDIILDSYNYSDLEKALDTKLIGKEIRLFDLVDSTNVIAKDWAIKGGPEGGLVIAEGQTRGRGRLGRSWASPKGKGLWMSLILRPNIGAEDIFIMTIIVSLALRRTLVKLGLENTKIKWPNDIVVNERKMSGILLDLISYGMDVDSIIVGIGINVNMDRDDIPEEVRHKASSLKLELGRGIDRSYLLSILVKELEDIYLSFLEDKNKDMLMAEYKEHSIILNKKVRVISAKEEFLGLAKDYGEDGSLIVEKSEGSTVRVLAGDVSIRGEDGYV